MDFNYSEQLNRLTDIRSRMIITNPFFGRLLMNVNLKVEAYENKPFRTAYTDMENIVFHPEFLGKLTDSEVAFIMKHELYHIILEHCVRGHKYKGVLYNIAADIVINSLIMDEEKLTSLTIAGQPVMNSLRDIEPFLEGLEYSEKRSEGKYYTAEEIYSMFKKCRNTTDKLPQEMDSHDGWEGCENKKVLARKWRKRVADCSRQAGVMSEAYERLLQMYEDYDSKMNWKYILRDFLQTSLNQADYTFTPPDRRFGEWDIFLPDYNAQESFSIDNIWFVVDTSDSMEDEVLRMVVGEIQGAINQIGDFRADISFFSNAITRPVEITDTDELLRTASKCVGGGTDFSLVFRYMKEKMTELPKAVIIMTDGQAAFPPIEASMDVPVLWVLTDMTVEAPWGINVYI